MNINIKLLRAIHRDTAYFFLGLIIAFSISGIALNHRVTFDPQEYVLDIKKVHLTQFIDKPSFDKQELVDVAKQWGLEEAYRGFRHDSSKLRVFFKEAYLTVDLKTGDGELEISKVRPVLGQMTILHKSTSTWWIWFSDIFGVAMLTIAISGALLSQGKSSFATRGWILSLTGLIFPFIFLFLLN
jgi:hypothetical protein